MLVLLPWNKLTNSLKFSLDEGKTVMAFNFESEALSDTRSNNGFNFHGHFHDDREGRVSCEVMDPVRVVANSSGRVITRGKYVSVLPTGALRCSALLCSALLCSVRISNRGGIS